MPELVVLASLLISAAASLQAPLDEAVQNYQNANPGVTIDVNFGGSNALARQVENGAPTDLLLSAAPEPVERLVDAGLIPATAVTPFLVNTLVLIASSERLDLTKPADLTAPTIKTIAIGEPRTAPAGAYAIEALTHLELIDALQPKFIYGKDVRQVLTWVATGNADAGFVYATDVTDAVRLVAPIDPTLHRPIHVVAALVRDTPDSRAFLEYLLSPASTAIFRAHRFTPLNPQL